MIDVKQDFHQLLSKHGFKQKTQHTRAHIAHTFPRLQPHRMRRRGMTAGQKTLRTHTQFSYPSAQLPSTQLFFEIAK